MRQTMEQHKAEYRARPISERCSGVFSEVAAEARTPSKAYKPTHGGYPTPKPVVVPCFGQPGSLEQADA